MCGFQNKVLHVNLSRRAFEEESIDDAAYSKFLGGKRLATYLLQNNTRAGVDPFSEDNVIIFATGPVADTKVFGSSRYGAFTKSPLTGIYGESYAGGSVSEPLSQNQVIFSGSSSEIPIFKRT